MKTYHLLDAIVRQGSLRKAASAMAIAPSALNRRVLSIEKEFGVELFERTAKGLKLTAAGELVIHHVRTQISDLERVKSRIDDLKGNRSGHIAIACSQTAMNGILHQTIKEYNQAFPAVTFNIRQTLTRESASLLQGYEVDLSLDFTSNLIEDQSITVTNNLKVLASSIQSLFVIMHPAHPLAGYKKLRLYQCTDFPLALPDSGYELRKILDGFASRMDFELRPRIVSDNLHFLEYSVQQLPLLTFRLGTGPVRENNPDKLVSIKLEGTHSVQHILALKQLKKRSLPVAAAQFAELLCLKLVNERTD